MANVWETFTDSYLKKLKRPELQGIFNPDQSYGANMLFRSEETNPWAGRDQSNAKFGPMGASGGITAQAPTLNPQGARDLLPQGWNLPMMPSPQQDTFHQLMGGIQGPVANIGGKIGADAIMDWMKSSPQGDAAEAIMSARESGRMAQELAAGPYNAAAGVGPGGEAVEPAMEALGGGADVAGGASSAIPFIGAGLKLGTGALTGKLQKQPGSTVGSAAGGAIGATAGTAIFPGVGTVIGGLAGSLIGDKIGTFADKGFTFDSVSNLFKMPDLNPATFLKGLFGGGSKGDNSGFKDLTSFGTDNISAAPNLGAQTLSNEQIWDVLSKLQGSWGG